MLIIDSQIHLWEADRADRPWPPDGRAIGHRLENPLQDDEAIKSMDCAGVTMAVLVPPSFEGDRNDVVAKASLSRPDRFIAFGRLALDVPRSASWLQEELEGSTCLGFGLPSTGSTSVSYCERTQSAGFGAGAAHSACQ